MRPGRQGWWIPVGRQGRCHRGGGSAGASLGEGSALWGWWYGINRPDYICSPLPTVSRHFSTLPEALSLSTWPPLSLTLTFLHNHRRRLCARLHHPWGMLTRGLHTQGGCAWAHARRPPSINLNEDVTACPIYTSYPHSSLQSCCCGGCCCQTCAFGGCCCKTCVSVSAVAGLSPAYTYTGALSRPRECPDIYDAPNSCFSLRSWHRTCRIVHG